METMERTRRASASFGMESTLLEEEELGQCIEFIQRAVAVSRGDSSRQYLLSSIPGSDFSSYAPLATLSALLAALPGPWPILGLQQTHQRLWKALPEAAKAGNDSRQAHQMLDGVLDQCKRSYSSLTDLIRPSAAPAIIDPQTGHWISHQHLSAQLQSFALRLPIQASGKKPVVAISLPNGPLLATTVLNTATYYTAAPVAYGSGVGAQQFKSDVLQSRASAVIASAADISRLGLHDAWLTEAGISVFLAVMSDDMTLIFRDLDGNELQRDLSWDRPKPNSADDTAILLFTSGTSGTKKLVPLTVHSLVGGITMVVESWGLSPSMRCLNQMPLHHVGGLVRNLFTPVMSGGSVICCSAFDANKFWDCVEDWAPTWYYASPSMHQCILEAAADRPEALEKSQIRLVCNAAGGLLPSLANRLRDTFSSAERECIVLPSYGMTECMPISTPPLSYRLDRSGTSGISVGPEIEILDANDRVLPAGVHGRISVRGAPVFGGYLRGDGTIDKSCFTHDGRFDTGDMGYLDQDGYLYINGRSKEVINRGGELISPFEIEEAVMRASSDPISPIFERVAKTLAFSVKYDVLQEVAGLVITKQGKSTRPSLTQIQAALKPILGQVKLPSLVVYMDNGVPTNNNKVLRIKLAERLALPEISDATEPVDRHYEAVCPPANTPLSVAIDCARVPLPDPDAVESHCQRLLPSGVDAHITADDSASGLSLLLAPSDDMTNFDDVSTSELTRQLNGVINGYDIPTSIRKIGKQFPRTRNGSVDDAALKGLLDHRVVDNSPSVGTSTEDTICKLFAEVLGVPQSCLGAASDFFDAGGDSMKAGRLLSALRKEFKLRISIDVLFANSSISALAAVMNDKLGKTQSSTEPIHEKAEAEQELKPGCEETYSSTNPFLLALQLTPLIIFWPMRRALTWTIFMYCLSYTQRFPTNASIPGRLFNLVLSMGVGRLVTRTLAPFLAIMFKWAAIGRYREGLYPMWGAYHTRWWLCEKIIATAGIVGKNVTINRGATLGEYDLITIEDNAVLERCRIRPMAPERNTSMYLGRILIGANASIGLSSIVAPGTVVPTNACVGPNSSSWEIEDADEANRDLAASKIPGAHWALTLFLGLPLQTLAAFTRALPWLACLVALVRNQPNTATVDQVREVIIWFASPGRVGWHYLALAANAMLGPFFLFAAVLVIKKILDAACGKIEPGPAASRSAFTTFRVQLIRTLLPTPRLHKLTELFGTHYEATSVFMRALGAKVGKHVYWPGNGPSLQDYDSIEVGDNVVFGSRAHNVTLDGASSEVVRIKNNAMVADRVVLLPGSGLGEKTVMGSGALAKRGTHYPAGTTWVGSKKNEAVCLSRPAVTEKSPAVSTNVCASHLAAPTPLRSALSSRQSSRTSLSWQVSFDTSSNMSTYSDAEKHPQRGLIKHFRSSDPLVLAHQQPTAASPPSEADLSPFGRAFYRHLAPYRVWTQPEIFLYSSFITVLTAVWWNIGSISALQIIARLYGNTSHGPSPISAIASAVPTRPIILYFLFFGLIVAIMALQSIATLALLIAAKWLSLGRRTPGSYDWDQSPYCQRWQLYLKLETLRRNCYGGNGILGMLTGTHWMVLYFRALGAKIGRDCALFCGGNPSLLFTEPDLLTLGDRVAVDDASLVGHINTAGRFSLNELKVGDRSVLRSGSRLLSGGVCEREACLLEHTLVMGGEVVEEGRTVQGWPAGEFEESRMPTLGVRRVWGRKRE